MNNKSIHIETTKRTVVLIAIIAMTFMATLDSSIVNVALPVLSEKLNVTISAVEWVIASYSIIICSTILFWGRLKGPKNFLDTLKMIVHIAEFSSSSWSVCPL